MPESSRGRRAESAPSRSQNLQGRDLPPHQQAFEGHTGPFIFEFQNQLLPPDEFLSKLDVFLGQLSTQYRYAVEVRSPNFLTGRYCAVLQAHQVAHIYNHWTYMPPLMEQHRRLGQTFTAPFTLLRLLTPLRVKYEDAVKRWEPYNRIVKPLPEMRMDTVRPVRQAVGRNDGRTFSSTIDLRGVRH